MELIELLKIAGALFGTVITALFAKRIEPALRPRNRLKADLEILSLMTDDDPNRERVQASVNKSVNKIYKTKDSEGKESTRNVNWGIFVLGIISFPGFSVWTWYIVRDGFSWWALGTGFLAFISIGWISIAFENYSNKETPPTGGKSPEEKPSATQA